MAPATLTSMAFRRNHVPRRSLRLLITSFALTAIVAACSQQQRDLSRLPCDAGRCALGYVCHPELQLCVKPVVAGCSGNGDVCPATTKTGDACAASGAFLPCREGASGCEGGCRTCTEALSWSACTPACEGLGTAERCSSCSDNCHDKPHVAQGSCDAAGGAHCVVTACQPGFVDLDPAAPGCECQIRGTELCNGLDDDCDGAVDEFSSAGALRITCSGQYPLASNVTSWRCNQDCIVESCSAGWRDLDHQAADGCEYACTSTTDESCNNADDDCNGVVDDVAPAAIGPECQARFPLAKHVATWGCSLGECTISSCAGGYSNSNTTISDGCEGGCVPTSPPAEVCDGVDNDCDGTVDNENASGCTTYYRDDDQDGFGQTGVSKCLCAAVVPYTASVGGDCDDDTLACGAACYPGNPAPDLCDGKDDDCSGADGEDDPKLTTPTACVGSHVDKCADDTYVSCTGGLLVCSAGADNYEGTGAADAAASCSDNVDNDCDGAKDCCDAGCMGLGSCTGLQDADGDGFTNGASCDCDDGIPTCTTDCTSDSDADGVKDCVESFCGSDPHDAASKCLIVNATSSLDSAILAANSHAGPDFILVDDNITVGSNPTDLLDTAGVTVHMRVGKTITVNANAVLFEIPGNNNKLVGLTILYSAGPTRAIVLSGNDNLLDTLKLTFNAAVGSQAIQVLGARNVLKNLDLTTSGNNAAVTDLQLAGEDNRVDGLKLTHGTGTVTRCLDLTGEGAVVKNVTATFGGNVTTLLGITGPEASVSSLTASTPASGYTLSTGLSLAGAKAALKDITLNLGGTTTTLVDISANEVSLTNLTAAPVASANPGNLGTGIQINGGIRATLQNVQVTVPGTLGTGVNCAASDNQLTGITFTASGAVATGASLAGSANHLDNFTLTANNNLTQRGVYLTAPDNAVTNLGLSVSGTTATGIELSAAAARSSFTWSGATPPKLHFTGAVANYGLYSAANDALFDGLTMEYDNNTPFAVELFNTARNRLANCLLKDSTPLDASTGATTAVYITTNAASPAGDSNVVTNCTIAKFKQRGIYVLGNGANTADGNLIYRNLVFGGTGAVTVEYGGVVLNTALDTRLVGNTIVNNACDAVQLRNCASAGHTTFIDQNTLAYSGYGLVFQTAASTSVCVRNNNITNNTNTAIRCWVAGNPWAASQDCSTLHADWQNNAFGNTVGVCDAACGAACPSNLFRAAADPGYATRTDVSQANYFCLETSGAAATLIDSDDYLGPSDASDPLSALYDLNGAAAGQYNDTPGISGNGPDIGGRESGAFGCP
jgi:hypothetical protein